MNQQTPSVPRALFAYSLLYGGLVVLAGVLGTKLASLGHWPLLGDLAVESGIFAFLMLVVLSSTVAELYAVTCAFTGSGLPLALVDAGPAQPASSKCGAVRAVAIKSRRFMMASLSGGRSHQASGARGRRRLTI